jgi:hypothetical protein
MASSGVESMNEPSVVRAHGRIALLVFGAVGPWEPDDDDIVFSHRA